MEHWVVRNKTHIAIATEYNMAATHILRRSGHAWHFSGSCNRGEVNNARRDREHHGMASVYSEMIEPRIGNVECLNSRITTAI